MLLDVVTGYMDMVERHEKGLMKEHKLATEKIGMIKCRDLRGALVTDIELRDLVEKNISNHEVVLTDLESRQVCHESKHCHCSTIFLMSGLCSGVSPC